MPSLSATVATGVFFVMALCGANGDGKLVGAKSPLTAHDLEEPSLLALGYAIATHFDASSLNKQSVFTSAEIVSGTKQVVAGMRYDLTVHLFATECEQNVDSPPSAEHPCTQIGEPICVVEASVWSRPWMGAPIITLGTEKCRR